MRTPPHHLASARTTSVLLVMLLAVLSAGLLAWPADTLVIAASQEPWPGDGAAHAARR